MLACLIALTGLLAPSEPGWVINVRQVTPDVAFQIVAASPDLGRIAYVVTQGGAQLLFVDGVKVGLAPEYEDLTFTSDGKAWYALRKQKLVVNGEEASDPFTGSVPREAKLFAAFRLMPRQQLARFLEEEGYFDRADTFPLLRARRTKFNVGEEKYSPTKADAERLTVKEARYQYLAGTPDSIAITLDLSAQWAEGDDTQWKYELWGSVMLLNGKVYPATYGATQSDLFGRNESYLLGKHQDHKTFMLYQSKEVVNTGISAERVFPQLLQNGTKYALAYNKDGNCYSWLDGKETKYESYALANHGSSKSFAFRDSGELAVAMIDSGGRSALMVGSKRYPEAELAGPVLFDRKGNAIVPVRSAGKNGFVQEGTGLVEYWPKNRAGWTCALASRRFGISQGTSDGYFEAFDADTREWVKVAIPVPVNRGLRTVLPVADAYGHKPLHPHLGQDLVEAGPNAFRCILRAREGGVWVLSSKWAPGPK